MPDTDWDSSKAERIFLAVVIVILIAGYLVAIFKSLIPGLIVLGVALVATLFLSRRK